MRWKTGMLNNIRAMRTAIKNIREVAVYGYPFRYRLLLLAIASPLNSLPMLLTPLVVGTLIDKAYPKRDFHMLVYLAMALIILRVLPGLLTIGTRYLSTYVRTMFDYRLTLQVYRAMSRASQSYHDRQETGMFLERASGDVTTTVSCIVNLWPKLASILCTFFLAIPLMMNISIKVSLSILAIVPINYMINTCITNRTVNLIREQRRISEKLTSFLSESVKGNMLIRLFPLGRTRRKRLLSLLHERIVNAFQYWKKTVLLHQLGGILAAIWGTLLMCLGWYLVFMNKLQLGQAVALGMYISVLSKPFQELEQLYKSLIADSVSAQRILQLFKDSQIEIHSDTRKKLNTAPNHYRLRELSFSYRKDQPCLRALDLSLHRGQTIAIIGPTGGGKSTLLRILCGLDTRYKGKFLVDGYDFHGIDNDSYLRHVSYVPQTTYFFSDTVRNNLPNSKPSEGIVLNKYSETLGVDEVISATPHAYDTMLGCKGVRLSSGQYQKLAVLRAMLKNASLLLLDEATASLDIESERKLLEGIVKLRQPDSITVLVTHHIEITAEPWIDQIVVITDGRIAEKGSYAELWEKGGFYHHWLSLNRGNQTETSPQTC